MPTICMFLGIIIRMYTRDEHNPPHFHAFYQDYEAVFSAEGELLEGKMPPRQTKFIVALWHGQSCTRKRFWRTGSWLLLKSHCSG